MKKLKDITPCETEIKFSIFTKKKKKKRFIYTSEYNKPRALEEKNVR